MRRRVFRLRPDIREDDKGGGNGLGRLAGLLADLVTLELPLGAGLVLGGRGEGRDPMLADLALFACLASTLFMTGLIWFVQVVHYPLFQQVGTDAFRAYHAAHARRTTFVVVGPMLIELATSVVLVVTPPLGVNPGLVWLGLASALVSWGSTGLVQVPCHDRLVSGYRADVARRLVRTNWVRVASWTSHAVILLVMTAGRVAA